MIYKGPNFAGPEGWSPDGQSIAFSMQSTTTKSFDIGIVPAAGGPLRGLLASAGNERGAAFSPDGRWLAYVSDESGRTELYVTRYPEGSPKWQISSGGVFVSGASLLNTWWSAPGEITYAGSDRRVSVVPVKPESTGLSIARAAADLRGDALSARGRGLLSRPPPGARGGPGGPVEGQPLDARDQLGPRRCRAETKVWAERPPRTPRTISCETLRIAAERARLAARGGPAAQFLPVAAQELSGGDEFAKVRRELRSGVFGGRPIYVRA